MYSHFEFLMPTSSCLKHNTNLSISMKKEKTTLSWKFWSSSLHNNNKKIKVQISKHIKHLLKVKAHKLVFLNSSSHFFGLFFHNLMQGLLGKLWLLHFPFSLLGSVAFLISTLGDHFLHTLYHPSLVLWDLLLLLCRSDDDFLVVPYPTKLTGQLKTVFSPWSYNLSPLINTGQL